MFGYSPKNKGNTVSIPIKNISSGLTQVVLSEIKSNSKLEKNIKAKLTYFSVAEQKQKEITIEKPLIFSSKFEKTDEVLKNYYIGKMAVAMKEMAKHVANNKKEEGLKVLIESLNDLNTKFPQLIDKDITRVRDILIKNIQKLDEGYRNNTNKNPKGYLLIPIR